ncbi:MAG: ABC transporter permease [Dehalococcoidia bacterium]|nr:ABC transporter permease [Dehalococcoidia bacterium]
MTSYAIRRLLFCIPVLFVVMLTVFVATRALPGDYALQQLSTSPFAPDDLRELRHQLGYDQPLIQQFGEWAWDVVRFDLGTSFQTNSSVTEELFTRLEVTGELGLLSMVVALLIAIPIGVLSAVRQDSILDYVSRFFAILGLALPEFWLATIVLLLPAIWWQWSPPVVYKSLWEDPATNLQMMLLPALVGGLGLGAVMMRLLRSSLLEVLRQDYIRTAWSKGLRERHVIMGHALRNASLPLLTVTGIAFVSRFLGGAVILETIFTLPGIGQYTLRAFTVRDYPVVQGAVLLVAAGVVLSSLIVDLLYAVLDPRIKYA